jgi:hypothetical protein
MKYKYSRLINLILLFCAGMVGGGLVTIVLTHAYRELIL